MAEPGRFKNFLGRVGDKFVPGDNYNSQTGQWSATPLQYLGAAVGPAVGMMTLNP